MGIANSEVSDENPDSPLINKQINRQMHFNTFASKELRTSSCLQSKQYLKALKLDSCSKQEVEGQIPKTVPNPSSRKLEFDQRGTYIDACINSKHYYTSSSQKISEENKIVEGQSGDAYKMSKENIKQRLNYKEDIFSSLPYNVWFKIVSYGISNFKSIIHVNSSWRRSIMESFDIEFNDLETKFVNKYTKYLFYKQANTSCKKIISCEIPGVRVDRVIRFEPLQTIKGKTITFGYSFKYTGDRKNRYKVIFIFDTMKMQARIVWAYLNECHVSI